MRTARILAEAMPADLMASRHWRETKVLVWARGGADAADCWLVIPMLKSVGGGAGIFATPSSIDVESSSPPCSFLSVDPNGGLSGMEVVVTLLEIPSTDWKDMTEYVTWLRAAVSELNACLHCWVDGCTPRSSSLLQLLKSGPLANRIQELPAEQEDENYETADDFGTGRHG